MNILGELKDRFRTALADLVDDPAELLSMVRPAQDARFGDYQANCAMPLGKLLGQSPRDIAARIVQQLQVADICEQPDIAGPGFINLRLQDRWLAAQLGNALHDERLGVSPVTVPRTIVLDYSSPNVAKPMHVGHIRSTVIGDALCRTLRFLGHQVISDNHLGDWGTQFGMIIYGSKHFRNHQAYQADPVTELGRLYKLVNQLVEYGVAKQRLPELEQQLVEREMAVQQQQQLSPSGDKSVDKKSKKDLKKLQERAADARAGLNAARGKLSAVDQDPQLSQLAAEHADVGAAVLQETAKLHAGDEQNRGLWHEFLPQCRQAIQQIYDRIDVRFDCEHGESFYQDRLVEVVQDFQQRGLASESEGATCVFLDGFHTPMIIRKQDGAFLYATSDLATIQFRMEQWEPDAILYVVDHRQSEHFEKLFAAARLWGYRDVELRHISFGTVLGEDGRPFKTRGGDTVGLEGLLDEAVRRAYDVLCENDDAKQDGPELAEDERQHVAQVVGHAAIKYADLTHNRTSDYVFSYEKMVALSGNTATYMQYSYARVNGIFAKGGVDVAALRQSAVGIQLREPSERALALELMRFGDALADTVDDYRPNQLTSYLFELTKVFFTFYEKCPVLRADSEPSRDSRLLLCDLTARTIKQGLQLLGIDVVDRM